MNQPSQDPPASGENTVTELASAPIPTQFGEFQCRVFEERPSGEQHLAMVMGEIDSTQPVLARVHSECLTGDLMGSLRCDCGVQLQAALARIAEEGTGVVVYLRGHEGRGIGLVAKLQAYNLQDKGHDTVDANLELGLPVDSRDYGIGAQILHLLGVRQLHLMTNNPSKSEGLEGFGLEVLTRVPLESVPNERNIDYLRTKRDRMGHLFTDLDN